MKKKVLILLGVLIGLYAVLTMVDTSEYRVEKRMWRMRKQFAAVAQDPKAVPDAQFERVVRGYRRLIKKFPKSRYVPQMYSEIGSLYLLNKKYDDARQAYLDVANQFSDHANVAAKAMLDVGNSYVIEGKLDKGVNVLEQVWKDYGRVETGFIMPVYIAGLYRNAGTTQEAGRWLEQGERYYRGIAQNEQEPLSLRLNAFQMLATVYLAQEKWEGALEVLRGMLYDFADSGLITPQHLRMLTRMINVTAIARLRDIDRASGIYRDFIQDHPGHFLNQFLEKIIESLEYLKTQEGTAVLQR